MEKSNLLFCVFFLLFALAVNGLGDTASETGENNNDEDKKSQQDPMPLEESEDVALPVPVAFWPLNTKYRTDDLLKRAQFKARASNVKFTSGPYNAPNGAYEFAGTSTSYIEFPNRGGILDVKYSITMMCWVRPGGKDGPLFSYKKADPHWGVHIWVAQAGRFFNRITRYPNRAFFQHIQTDQPLKVGKWVHVAATYDHNTGWNAIYVDGVLKKRQNIGTGFRISTNDPAVRMGVKDGDRRFLKGAVTQMGLYNVSLTAKQILAVRKQGLPNPCASSPCLNGGTCVNKIHSFQCKCTKGNTGPTCSQRVNPCDSNPCRNGGTCSQSGDQFKCTCAKGFTGPRCTKDINECEHNKGGCQDICVNTVGSYHCACSDPEFSLAKDKRHCIAEGVGIDCGQNDMTIYIPKNLLLGLDRQHLRLIDVNCRAYENKTHFALRTQLIGCKTEKKHKGEYVTYHNMVSEIPLKQNQIVTRVRNAMIPFYCCYSKWGVVSSIGIKPSSKKVILSSKGYGKFTLILDIFKKYDFKHPFSKDDFPVMFNIRERMYVQLTVDTQDARLTILALDCYATPSQDRNSRPRYDIIKDGCAVDNTLKFHPSPDSRSQRFSLEAFQYVSKHPYVFLHCNVKVCDARDPNSRCKKGCVQRGRRSAKALHDNPDDVYPLAQGPFTQDREKREVEADEPLESDERMRVAKSSIQLPVVAALAVVIGVCAVGMSYMAWQKKRGKTARQYKPLYIDEPN